MTAQPLVPGVGTDPSADLDVLVRRLDPDLPLPAYAHPGDAGADLVARVDVTLQPGERRSVPTGLAVALPTGYAAFVHPRSGLAARYGVTTLNAPGTVDAGYRGEIHVILVNTDGGSAVTLRRGERIAQLVVQRVERVAFVVVDDLPGSARGAGGHGSTGGFAGQPARPGSNASTDLSTHASTNAGQRAGGDVGASAPEGETP